MDLFHSPEELTRQLEAAKARVREIEENDDPTVLMGRLRAAHPSHLTLWFRMLFGVASALAAVAVVALLAVPLFAADVAVKIKTLEHAVGLPLPVVGLVVSVCMAIGYYMMHQAALAIGRSCPLMDYERKEHDRHMTDVRQLTGQKSILERMRATPKGARTRGATPAGAVSRFGGEEEGPPTRQQRGQISYTPPAEIPNGKVAGDSISPTPQPAGKRERTPIRADERDDTGPRMIRNLPKPALNAEGFLGTPVQDLVRQHTRKTLPEKQPAGPVRGKTTPEDPDQLVRVRRDNRVPLPMSDLDDDRDETTRLGSDQAAAWTTRRASSGGDTAWPAPAARSKQTEDDEIIEEDPRVRSNVPKLANNDRKLKPLNPTVDPEDEPTADMDSYSEHVAPSRPKLAVASGSPSRLKSTGGASAKAAPPTAKAGPAPAKGPMVVARGGTPAISAAAAAAEAAAERKPTPRASRRPSAEEPWVTEVLEKAQKTSQILPVQARFLYGLEPTLPFTLSLDRMTAPMAVRVTETYLEFLAAIPTPPRARIVLNDPASVDRGYLRNVENALEPHFDDRAKVSRNGDFVDIRFLDPDPAWRDAPDLSKRR